MTLSPIPGGEHQTLRCHLEINVKFPLICSLLQAMNYRLRNASKYDEIRFSEYMHDITYSEDNCDGNAVMNTN